MTLTTDILERDNYQCQYCGGQATEADHIFSKAEGRRHGIARDDTVWIVAACHDCNGQRGTLTLVPPSWEYMIPRLNEITPSHTWRVYRGGPVSDAFRKVHTA